MRTIYTPVTCADRQILFVAFFQLSKSARRKTYPRSNRLFGQERTRCGWRAGADGQCADTQSDAAQLEHVI